MVEAQAISLSNTPLLSVQHLYKSFGAVQATNDVNIDVRAGEIHALIGPNGAGKSTLISQICGEQRPDSGQILISGHDVTTTSAHARARLGLGRSFQITELCADYTSLENVLLSLVAKGKGIFRMWRNPRRNARLVEQAMERLEQVGMAHRASVVVADLAHGEKRQLELAVALAREPRLLLLDEPMAGMGSEESSRMTEQLMALKKEYGMLLVEHDMDAVFALADRITVLVYGKTIFTGSPQEVRTHPEVRAAYLGDHA